MTNQIVYRNFCKPRFRVNFFLTSRRDVCLGVQGRLVWMIETIEGEWRGRIPFYYTGREYILYYKKK